MIPSGRQSEPMATQGPGARAARRVLLVQGRARGPLAWGISLLLATCVLAIVCLSPTVARADGVDYAFSGYTEEDLVGGRTGSITLDYENAELDGVEVNLYRIADVSTEGFTFTDDFKPYVSDIEWLKDEESQISEVTTLSSNWDVVAQTLVAHAQAGDIAAYRTTYTVAGQATFSDLPAGLYLYKATNTTVGGLAYTFSPAIVALPTPGTNGAASSYDVVAWPKSSSEPVEPHTMRVVKHWQTVEGSDAVASVQGITVQILRDGVAWGSPIVLSDANNWSYSWEDTEGNHEWSASEEAVSGSGVVWSSRVTLSGDDTIVITNTEVGGGDEGENDGDEDEDLPFTGGGTSSLLPQTGEAWAVVPVLLVAALGLLAASRWLGTRGRERDASGRNEP